MKTISKAVILTISIVMIASYQGFSQGSNWKLDGNNNVSGTNNKIGSTNNADVKIVTNDQTRIKIGNDGTTEFFGKVKMTSDSLNVKGFIQVDSMRVKGSLHIGDSSLWIGNNPFTGTDNIQSNQSRINFGRIPAAGVNFSNITLGVGIANSNTNVKMHLHDRKVGTSNPLVPVLMQFSNIGNSGTGTGFQFTDGFLLGINSNGEALLNQQENLPMWFNTGSLPRMTITSGDGFVGIGNYNNFVPNSFLHVDGNSIATATGEVFRTVAQVGQNNFCL